MVGRFNFPGTATHVSAIIIVGKLDVRLILAEFAATVITDIYFVYTGFAFQERRPVDYCECI